MKRAGLLFGIILSLCCAGSVFAQQAPSVNEEEFNKSFKAAVESQTKGINNAQYCCPRYLLRWSMGFYTEGAKERAVTIAKAAGTIIDTVTDNIKNHETALDTRYPEDLKDPQIKQKMLDYLGALKEVTNYHLQYFESGDQALIDKIDAGLNRAAQFDQDVEKLTGGKIAVGLEAITSAAFMCPRWLVTLGESFTVYENDAVFKERGYVKDVVKCDSCAETVKAAKTINGIVETALIPAMPDAELKKKYAEYIKVSQQMDDAFIKIYQTGDKQAAEDPYKLQQKALDIDKEINQYLEQHPQQ